MSEWQPIETAPKDGTWILLCGGKPDHHFDAVDDQGEEAIPPVVVGQWNGFAEYWRFASYDSGYYGEYESPTNWMPLPAPPSKPVG